MSETIELEIDSSEVEVVEAQASAIEIDNRLRTDYEFFAEFFLGGELERSIPEFHFQTWDLMTSAAVSRVLMAIPREHAKTTQAKLSAVWHFMFTDRRFMVYLSNTNTIALNACKDIFAFFETQNYINTYGAIEVETASEGNSLWIFKIKLANGKQKRCILRAMGANQQMRGINIDNQRPDIAVVDDVEDLENTESEKLQKKLDKWIFSTFIKALTRNHKIIWIGNMLRKTSLLARLTTNPAFKEKWSSLVLGALIRNPVTNELEPLWPELWSLEALRADYQEYLAIGQAESWFCEMMNMPGHGENGFQPEQMHYHLVGLPEDYLATFITIDPAFGLDASKHDRSAIVVHGIPKDGPPQVLCYKTGNMTEPEIFRESMAFTRHWKCWTWGIERVAAQKVLLTLFELYLLQMQEYRVRLEALDPSTSESKGARIKVFVNMMSDHTYALPLGDIDATQQFLNYDLSMKDQVDDLIDGISYGPQMLLRYRGKILENAQRALNIAKEQQNAARVGTEVACV